MQVSEIARKKRRALNKSAARAIGNVSLEVINKRKTEKPEVRQASRDAALREIKERAKKLKAEKKGVSEQGCWLECYVAARVAGCSYALLKNILAVVRWSIDQPQQCDGNTLRDMWDEYHSLVYKRSL